MVAASSSKPSRVSGGSGGIGWRQQSDLITPPSIMTALAALNLHSYTRSLSAVEPVDKHLLLVLDRLLGAPQGRRHDFGDPEAAVRPAIRLCALETAEVYEWSRGDWTRTSDPLHPMQPTSGSDLRPLISYEMSR